MTRLPKLPKNLIISVTITQNQIEGLLDSASRGALYWCQDAEVLGYERYVSRILNGGQIKLGNDEVEGEDKLLLNMETLKEGLRKMSLLYPSHFGDILSDEADNLTGDVLLQCALLGDVLYG